MADYDRIKNERDELEVQTNGLLEENETLYEKIRRIEQERERFSQTLTECASQVVAIGARATELAKIAKAQAQTKNIPSSTERRAAPLAKREPMIRPISQKTDYQSTEPR
jgi:uncharacterized protein YoxC